MSHYHRSTPLPPFTIAFSGLSGAGKTTLIGRLIEQLSSSYSIGYIKHDAHHFSMDTPGKDTDRISKSGASMVSIQDPSHWAMIAKGNGNKLIETLSKTYDMTFIEGYKTSKIPKIIVLDDHAQILNDDHGIALDTVIAYVGASHTAPDVSHHRPYFQRDNMSDIISCILDYFKTQIPVLYGLLLTGGKSSRMGKDKSTLHYQGQSQETRALHLLSQITDQVFISKKGPKTSDDAVIYDVYDDIGPLSGILSAQRHSPSAAWLVLACDLPFVTQETLETLVMNRNPFKTATAYQSSTCEKSEPLCAIYEPKSQANLLAHVAKGSFCPRHILDTLDIQLLQQAHPTELDNINTPEDYQAAHEKLGQEKEPVS